ncbi:MAG: M60 family metallopeptidase [Akkermansia sp.]|nr:M60 family metallopeptidase [Akkermansia sp.]
MKPFSYLVLILVCLYPLSMQAAVPQSTDLSTLNSSADAESSYRNRVIRAYLPIEKVRETLRTNNYSHYENPTGIYFRRGEQVRISVQGPVPRDLALIIHDFGESGDHAVLPLLSGGNTFSAPAQGLAYLDYRSENPAEAPELQVRIEGGQVNGIFTQHDDADTWKKLLDNAKCNILDIVGERVQLAYNVDGLREHCPERGPELLDIYDSVVRMEQELLGWDKYGVHPGNHIHGRVQWGGFMHADGIGSAYVYSAMNEVANPDALRRSVWAIAHEFGHINQCRPGMMWAGSQEVTNNIFSAWCCYSINPANCRLEHEVTPVIGSHSPMRGGRMDCYVNNAIVNRQLWQFQSGPDNGLYNVPGARTGDHFVSVCPLWQLQLYMAVARDKKDFYADIHHLARNDAADSPHGKLRLQFFTRACDVTGWDLSDFFVKVGIVAPMNRYVEDYSSHMVTITPEMCKDAIAHARRYPKPDSSVIYYINANNVHIYRDRLPVQPALDYEPVFRKGIVTIPGDVWLNAVAYEAYDVEGNLLRVALRGLNHRDNATTDLICPPGTVCIKAVQWDGERFDLWSAM